MSKYKVIIPIDLKPSPAQYELSAAALLAHYFKSDVEFIPRSNHKTPDFLIKGVSWELKSPTGDGKYNIQHQIKSTAKQSCNVILDVRNSKMHMTKIRGDVQRHFKFTKAIKRLVLIDKSKRVVEISK
jgi:hypothetical protein